MPLRPPSRTALLASWALALLFLVGCLGNEDPEGSEVENEVSARIYLADGKPAAAASVKLYSVDHNPQEAGQTVAFSTRTDAQGRYVMDSLPRGEYNILAEMDGEVSYQDSVFLSGRSGDVQNDTLRAPGAIAGYVQVQPDHDPRTVTLQVLGTSRFLNVDERGGFVLEGLAEGAYRVRLVTTEPEYTPTFVTLRVRSGRLDTLPAPLVLTYTGIPVVEGLRTVVDTLSGTVRLAWKSVNYPSLSEYLVFRNSSQDLIPALMPIGRIRDTFFTDTLYRGRTGPQDTAREEFEYRVAVRSRSNAIGKTYDFAMAATVPPGAVRTHLALKWIGTSNGKISIQDTATAVLAYSNHIRTVRRIRWYVDGSSEPAREALPSPQYQSAEDRFTQRWDSAGSYPIVVHVTDEAGNTWKDSTRLEVLQDIPTVFKSPLRRIPVLVGASYRLQGQDRDTFGRIVKWEWDVGATGNFRSTAGPDTVLQFTSPDSLVCILRVTDDDGNQPVDTVTFLTFEGPKMVPVPSGLVHIPRSNSVQVKGFHIQTTEVTQGLYQAVMNKEPSHFKGSWDLPVENVSFMEVLEFCNRLSVAAGREGVYTITNGHLVGYAHSNNGFRLPIREEWQLAASGGTGVMDWEPETYEDMGLFAWHAGNSEGRTHGVASKAPNAYGLYDVSGNVSEFALAGLSFWGINVVGSNFGDSYPRIPRVFPIFEVAPSLQDKAIGFRLAYTH